MFCNKCDFSIFLFFIGLILGLSPAIVGARTTVSVDDDGTVVFWTRAKLCGPGMETVKELYEISNPDLLSELESSLEMHWNDAASLSACSRLRFDFTLETSDSCDLDYSKFSGRPIFVSNNPGWDTWYVPTHRPGVYDRAFAVTSVHPWSSDSQMFIPPNRIVDSHFGSDPAMAHRTLLHETTHIMSLQDRYKDKIVNEGGKPKVSGYVCDAGWEDTIGCDGWTFKPKQFRELSQNVRNSRFSDIVKDHIARSCIIRHIAMNTFNVQKQPPYGLSTTDERTYVRGRFTVSEYDDSTHLIEGEGNMYFTHISPETDQSPSEKWRLVGVNPGAFSVKGRLLNNCDIMESPEMCKLELDFDPVGGRLEALYTHNEFTNLKSGKVQTWPHHESVETMFRAGFFDPFEVKLNSIPESLITIFKIKYEAGGTGIEGAGTLRFIDPTKGKPPSPFVPAAVSGGLP